MYAFLFQLDAEDNIWKKREEVTGGWRKLHMESVNIYTLHRMLLGCSNQRD
jgi:hypothetical protein